MQRQALVPIHSWLRQVRVVLGAHNPVVLSFEVPGTISTTVFGISGREKSS